MTTQTIAFDDAVKLLPEGEFIHTFRQAGHALLGAGHDRESLLAAMRAAESIEVTGPAAQAMDHGLALFDEHGVLFIETAKTHGVPA